MKKTYILLLAALFTMPSMAEENDKEKGITFEKYNLKSADLKQQTENIDMENGVLGIADDRGFTLQSRDGKFIFKPYLFLQTRGQYNYYDDEG
ncbi:MAG: porin, partial [Bacteroidaceae bacterium]|nr:porin [Bacteroidaceae bacterium]